MIKLKSIKLYKNIIGILLVIPIYNIILDLFGLVISTATTIENCFLNMFLLYGPIVVALILFTVYFWNRINIPVFIILLFAIAVSCYLFYNYWMVVLNQVDFVSTIESLRLWGLSILFCRILSLILYKKLVSWEKILFFTFIYIILVYRYYGAIF